MIIHGFQKMTLLDYPGKVACTLFSGGCNFRCPFCHNALLVTELENAETYSEDEIFSYLERRRGLLDGVCVTGGEPLLNKDIYGFIKKIKELGYSVKLDSNGSFPDALKKIVCDGLVDYVAMDIKNTPEKYALTVGVKNFDTAPILESVDFLKSGVVDFEFRTTVVREFHDVSDIANIAKWLSGAPKYFLQAFTDSGNLIGQGLHAQSAEIMEQMREAAAVYIPAVALRGI